MDVEEKYTWHFAEPRTCSSVSTPFVPASPYDINSWKYKINRHTYL
jgi:hypothetical protein